MSTTTAPQASQKRTGRILETSRLIDEPRELVFDAWCDPRHLNAWWGPDGFTTTTSAFDMRPGGIWRFVMHGPDGRDYENRIIFDLVERPARIDYRHDGGEDNVADVEFRASVTFEDVGGRTRLTMRAEFPSEAQLERVVREYGADEGATQTLGRLDGYARELAASTEDRFVARLVVVRSLDAPRALVWRAWTDPACLAAWWGPRGFTVPVCEIDARPGGPLRIDMQAPDGTVNMVTGVVEEIVEPERFVFTTVAFRDEQGVPALNGWNAVTLAEKNGKTIMTLEARIIAAAPWLAAGIAGMAEGWGQSLDKLGESLASPAPGRSVAHDTIVIERTFAAPPAAVFAAFESVEARERWSPPGPDLALVFDEADFRVGGRDVSRCGPRGDLAWTADARYEDIVLNRRIVQTETVSKRGARLGSALLTIELSPAGEGTRLVFTGQVAAYDGSDFIAGCRQGWTAALDNLAAELRRAV